MYEYCTFIWLLVREVKMMPWVNWTCAEISSILLIWYPMNRILCFRWKTRLIIEISCAARWAVKCAAPPHRSNIIMTNDSLCSAEYKKQTECVRSLALFLPLFSGSSYLGYTSYQRALKRLYCTDSLWWDCRVHRVNYLHGPTYTNRASPASPRPPPSISW